MKWILLIIFIMYANSGFAQTGSIRCKIMGRDSVRIKHGVARLFDMVRIESDSIKGKRNAWTDDNAAIQKVLVDRKGIAEFKNVPAGKRYVVKIVRRDYSTNYILKVPVTEHEETLVNVVLKWSPYIGDFITY